MFCYDTIENTVSTDFATNSTYVPYREVKGNEFFGCDEDAVSGFHEIKENLIARYPPLTVGPFSPAIQCISCRIDPAGNFLYRIVFVFPIYVCNA